MCSRSSLDNCSGVKLPFESQAGLCSLHRRQCPRTFILCACAKAMTSSPGAKLNLSCAGRRAPHFITFSGSTMLNSRASVAAYSLSVNLEGLTAVPTNMPTRSAYSRSDWARQLPPLVVYQQDECDNHI